MNLLSQQKILHVSLTALCASLPFGIGIITNILLLFVLVASLLLLKKEQYKAAVIQPIWWCYAVFFIFHVISLLWSSNVSSGLPQIETKLSFLFGSFFSLAVAKGLSKYQKHNLFKTFIWANVAVFTLCLLVSSFKSIRLGKHIRLSPGGTYTQNLFTYQALSEDFMHPGYMATYFGIAIILGFFYWKSSVGRQRLTFALQIFYLLLGMVLLQGRISLLALLIVGVGGLFFYVYRYKKYHYLSWLLAPFFAAVFFVIWAPKDLKERYLQMPDFSYNISGDNFNSATYRLAEWKCAIDAISKNPIIGSGVGDNRQALFKAYEENGFYNGLKFKYNAHNQYLETTIALGLIGLLLFMLLLFYYLWLSIHQQNWLLFTVLVFFMLCMLTESMLERFWAVSVFSILFPLLIHNTSSTYNLSTPLKKKAA